MKISFIFNKYIKNTSKSLLLKLFFICMGISLFIIVTLGVFVNFFYLNTFNNQIEKMEQRKIDETLNNIKIAFEEIKKTSLSFALNPDFSHFVYLNRDDFLQKFEEVRVNQNMLVNSVNSSIYLKDVFAHYEKNDYILDCEGIFDSAAFYDSGWKDVYKNMTGRFEIIDTRKIKRRIHSPNLYYDNVITFITRLPYNSDKKEGAIFLNVDSGILSDLLVNITVGNGNAIALIVNNAGTVISSNNSDSLYKNISDVINTPQNFDASPAGKYKCSINNIKMMVYYKICNINDWKFIYAVPENIFYKESSYVRSITVLVSIILLFIMILISSLVSFKVYSPIKVIMNNIKSISRNNNENISDVFIIKRSIDILFENNRNLEDQVQKNKELAVGMFLSRLITGNIFNKTEIKDKSEYYQVELAFNYFKVAVIQNDSSLRDSATLDECEYNKLALINIVEKVFSDLKKEINCSQDSNDNILVLIKSKSLEEIKELESVIEHIFEDIISKASEYLKLHIFVGIGKTYDDLANTGESYKGALEALQFKFLKEKQGVISINEICNSGKSKLYYPLDKEQKLISLIKQGDYEKAVFLLNDFLDDIMLHNKNFENIESCISNITGIIQRCLFLFNLDAKDVFDEKNTYNLPIDRFKNIEQYKDWICTRFRQIIEYQKDQEKGTTKDFTSEIKEYLGKVYMEEISLSSIAGNFNYNPSYFCKIFKDKLGISFWEYLAKLRVEKSIKLLIDTEYSVEQIAGLVGYNNRISYTRTFKKYIELTPGEYRQKYRNN